MEQLYTIIGIIGSTALAVWTLAWFLSRQITSIKSSVFDKLDKTESKILDKLEYHERHDDQRFGQIFNDLWSLRVVLASVGINGKEKDIKIIPRTPSP